MQEQHEAEERINRQVEQNKAQVKSIDPLPEMETQTSEKKEKGMTRNTNRKTSKLYDACSRNYRHKFRNTATDKK